MNALRTFGIFGAAALLTAWFVALGVRATVGAEDRSPQVAIGVVPTAPPSLPPLAIPARDPFAADAAGSTRSQPAAKLVGGPAIGGASGSQLASTNVPDVASLGGAAANVGVMATIVSDSEAYALVEDGGSVRVARVGDPLGGSIIAAITDKMVLLANGARISLDAPARAAGAPPPMNAAAAGAPSPAPSVMPGVGRAIDYWTQADAARRAGVPVEGRGRPGGQPFQVNASPPSRDGGTGISGFGRTVTTNPNGTPVQPPTSGTLFPSVVATPSVVPYGTLPLAPPQPGGHP